MPETSCCDPLCQRSPSGRGPRAVPAALVLLSPFFAALASPCPTWAQAKLQVSPVRLELTEGSPVAVLRVQNLAADQVGLQRELMSWTQEMGEDIEVPTEALIASPPLFTLPGNGDQLVRVGLLYPPDDWSVERAYRLILREVPPVDPRVTGIRLALRISLPIFLQPQAATKPPLDVRIQREPGKVPQLKVSNRGNAHVRITGVILEGAPDPNCVEAKMRYVLPGSTVSLSLDGAGSILESPPEGLELILQTDQGEYREPVSSTG